MLPLQPGMQSQPFSTVLPVDPIGHGTLIQAVEPGPPVYVPGGQKTQAVCAVPVTNRPTGHAVQDTEPTASLMRPAAQPRHASALEPPVTAENFPALQPVHAACPRRFVKKPAAQDVHVSALAAASAAEERPATHNAQSGAPACTW